MSFCSVAKSCLTLCDPMDCSQQASLSFTVSRVCSNSCLLSQWCHPTIWSSVTTFSSCPQSFPASGSFPVSWLFPSTGQNIGASSSASVLLTIIQGWFPLGLIGLISLLSKGLSRVSSSTTIWKHQVFWYSAFFMAQLSYLFMTTGKIMALIIWTFAGKVMSLLFNMLSQFVIAFLPKSKCLNFTVAVTVCSDSGAQENKICHCFCFSPSICREVMGPDAMISIFECWVLSQLFQSSLSPSSRDSLVPFLMAFCHKGGITCKSVVIDISPGSFDSCLWFIQPDISYDVLCTEIR